MWLSRRTPHKVRTAARSLMAPVVLLDKGNLFKERAPYVAGRSCPGLGTDINELLRNAIVFLCDHAVTVQRCIPLMPVGNNCVESGQQHAPTLCFLHACVSKSASIYAIHVKAL